MKFMHAVLVLAAVLAAGCATVSEPEQDTVAVESTVSPAEAATAPDPVPAAAESPEPEEVPAEAWAVSEFFPEDGNRKAELDLSEVSWNAEGNTLSLFASSRGEGFHQKSFLVEFDANSDGEADLTLYFAITNASRIARIISKEKYLPLSVPFEIFSSLKTSVDFDSGDIKAVSPGLVLDSPELRIRVSIQQPVFENNTFHYERIEKMGYTPIHQ